MVSKNAKSQLASPSRRPLFHHSGRFANRKAAKTLWFSPSRRLYEPEPNKS